jgi:hypothetical protein
MFNISTQTGGPAEGQNAMTSGRLDWFSSQTVTLRILKAGRTPWEGGQTTPADSHPHSATLSRRSLRSKCRNVSRHTCNVIAFKCWNEALLSRSRFSRKSPITQLQWVDITILLFNALYFFETSVPSWPQNHTAA